MLAQAHKGIIADEPMVYQILLPFFPAAGEENEQGGETSKDFLLYFRLFAAS
jgi:hypothetical protein